MIAPQYLVSGGKRSDIRSLSEMATPARLLHKR